MTAQITRANADGSIASTVARITRADLVVIDDIGMLPAGQAAAEAFYRVVEAAYERARPVLACVGNSVQRIGESGAGQVAKACNQILTGVGVAMVAEAMHFARSAGVDPAIAPFLSEPLVVDDADDAAAGIVVATQEGRVFTSPGDTIFATRITPGVPLWNVYRKARPLTEPVTGEILGYEATYLGQARVQSEAGVLSPDDADARGADGKEATPIPAGLMVTSAKQEIGKGDRLLPAGRPELLSYVPHAPEQEVNGRIVSIVNGVADTGRYHVVSLSLGKREGIEVGHVLSLHRNRGKAVYREDDVGAPQQFQLPEQRYGLVFVFRVFERISYGLVMESVGPVTVADSVRKP